MTPSGRPGGPVLADTSIWVAYLREGAHGPGEELDRLLADEEVLLCGPVVAELLAGVGEGDRQELWGLLASLPWAEIGPGEWRRTGEVAAALRSRGATVALSDIEIAVACVTAGAALWSADSDFERVSLVLPELRRFVPRRASG
ncbi:MAG: PIN domain-containing protein [Candidatus Dormibacteria bacterium]